MGPKKIFKNEKIVKVAKKKTLVSIGAEDHTNVGEEVRLKDCTTPMAREDDEVYCKWPLCVVAFVISGLCYAGEGRRWRVLHRWGEIVDCATPWREKVVCIGCTVQEVG